MPRWRRQQWLGGAVLVACLPLRHLAVVPLQARLQAAQPLQAPCPARLALVRGKQQHDKREDLKKRDAEREIARALNKR